MQFKHAPAAVSAMFDDPNLVSAAGLVPMLRLARSARRIALHLPEAWLWQTAFDRLFKSTHAPPPPTAS